MRAAICKQTRPTWLDESNVFVLLTVFYSHSSSGLLHFEDRRTSRGLEIMTAWKWPNLPVRLLVVSYSPPFPTYLWPRIIDVKNKQINISVFAKLFAAQALKGIAHPKLTVWQFMRMIWIWFVWSQLQTQQENCKILNLEKMWICQQITQRYMDTRWNVLDNTTLDQTSPNSINMRDIDPKVVHLYSV